jgi:hypothetical protein
MEMGQIQNGPVIFIGKTQIFADLLSITAEGMHDTCTLPDALCGVILKEGSSPMAGYSCMIEVTDEDGQVQQVMTLLCPQATPEIIRPFHGFIDGIVLLSSTISGSFSAISFFRSKAVSFWISRDDGGHRFQN